MRIGIDFDNTLCIYDEVFHNLFKSTTLIDQNTNFWKKEDYANALRNNGREDIWTTMQGYVYGFLVQNAKIASGFSELVSSLTPDDELLIISHKTEHSASREKFKLREAASDWITAKILPLTQSNNVKVEAIFLNDEKSKIDKIKEEKPDIFVDDLLRVCVEIEDTIERVYWYGGNDHRNIIGVQNWQDVMRTLR